MLHRSTKIKPAKPITIRIVTYVLNAPIGISISFLVSKLSSISTLLGSRRKICQRGLSGTWLTLAKRADGYAADEALESRMLSRCFRATISFGNRSK